MCAAPRERGGSSRRRGRASDPPRPKPENAATSGTSESTSPSLVRIGVIADSHGYLDPAVLELFAGVTHIVHAGDIVDPKILVALATVAPVTAVAGNLDTGKLADSLPREASGELPGASFVVCHKRKRLLKRLAAGKITIGPRGLAPNLVVFGHEHIPSAVWVEGTLLLNPGTASSPYEEDDDPTVAIVQVEPTGLSARFIPLSRRPTADDV
jgi:putative phosphoesterase